MFSALEEADDSHHPARAHPVSLARGHHVPRAETTLHRRGPQHHQGYRDGHGGKPAQKQRCQQRRSSQGGRRVDTHATCVVMVSFRVPLLIVLYQYKNQCIKSFLLQKYERCFTLDSFSFTDKKINMTATAENLAKNNAGNGDVPKAVAV